MLMVPKPCCGCAIGDNHRTSSPIAVYSQYRSTWKFQSPGLPALGLDKGK